MDEGTARHTSKSVTSIVWEPAAAYYIDDRESRSVTSIVWGLTFVYYTNTRESRPTISLVWGLATVSQPYMNDRDGRSTVMIV